MTKRRFEEMSSQMSQAKRQKTVVKPMYKKTNLKRAIEKVLRRTTELKEIQKVFSQNPTTSGGSIGFINDAIATGGDITDRIGRHITSKQIQVNYEISTITPTYSDSGFIALVYDKQPNGAYPGFTDIFNTLGGSSTTGLAFKNTASYADRFKVVKMDRWSINSAGPTNVSGRMFYKVPTRYEDTEYEDQTASPPTTGMWMVMVSSTSNGGAFTFADYTLKYQFTDK